MNKTNGTKRAAKGGEVGANGEFYEGGKFINTIPENRKNEGSRKSKPRKAQTGPFTWVIETEGRTPLFSMVGTVAGYIDRYNPAAGIEPSGNGVSYYGNEFHGKTVAEQCARYNAGEVWA